ncbi:MAG: hypothetical protein K8F91_24430, partial [Candidatus Obscuribacterales bacterium]|nr:hypothetical protein [Candidatus Obscuribacterales bacterium]
MKVEPDPDFESKVVSEQPDVESSCDLNPGLETESQQKPETELSAETDSSVLDAEVAVRELVASSNDGKNALLSTLALMMFIGGALVTLLMLARAFDMHGKILVGFVVGSCALVLSLAGSLMSRVVGDKSWVGAILGACFG